MKNNKFLKIVFTMLATLLAVNIFSLIGLLLSSLIYGLIKYTFHAEVSYNIILIINIIILYLPIPLVAIFLVKYFKKDKTIIWSTIVSLAVIYFINFFTSVKLFASYYILHV